MKPNFFLVGAPRSGTTALAQYLGEHPAVFMAPAKELHYFADDLARTCTSAEEYFSYFSGAGPEKEGIGEASVFYLYSHVALPRIRREIPDARIVVMLRSYVEFLRSFHGKLVYQLDEDVHDLEAAWRLQADRAAGRHMPPHCRDPAILQYRAVAMFGEQMERLLTVFPAEQVKVVFYDHFADDPGRAYGQVLAFLGLDDDGRREFPRVNSGAGQRSRALARLTQRPGPVAFRVGRMAKKVTGGAGAKVLPFLRRLNRAPDGPAPLEPAFLEELAETFRDDAAKLSRLVGRDVSRWATSAGPRTA